MDRWAIILAGGNSQRLGEDKGLLTLQNKPLVKHVLDAVDKLVDEKLVVVSSAAQAQRYSQAIHAKTRIAIDETEIRSPLAGALTGFKAAGSSHAALLACDTPLVCSDVLALLFELCETRNAAIPRWPTGYIEPLQAVYNAEPTAKAAEEALLCGCRDPKSMIARLRHVRYVSTLVLEQLDPQLTTFLNINTQPDLKRAETILKHRHAQKR